MPFETSGLKIKTTSQHVVLVASVPLTNEPWHPLAEGALVVVRNGELVPTASSEAQF